MAHFPNFPVVFILHTSLLCGRFVDIANTTIALVTSNHVLPWGRARNSVVSNRTSPPKAAGELSRAITYSTEIFTVRHGIESGYLKYIDIMYNVKS